MKESGETSRCVAGEVREDLLRRAELAFAKQDYLEADRLARLVVLEEVSNSTAAWCERQAAQ